MYQVATFTPAQLASLPKDLQQEVAEMKRDTQDFSLDLNTEKTILEQHHVPVNFLLKDDQALFKILQEQFAKQAIPATATDKKTRLQKALRALEIVLKRTSDEANKIKFNKAIKALSITLKRL